MQITTDHNIAANVALVRDFIDHIWNRQQAAPLDDYLSVDYIDHAYQPPNATGLSTMLGELTRAFPDAHQALDCVTAQNDMVVCRITLTATHQGQFRNVPASDNNVRVNVYRSFRIVNGKIAEHWALLDTANLLWQIGATVANQNACAVAPATA